MKKSLISIFLTLLFLSHLHADPFTGRIGRTKHEIVDSLLAVDQLSGSIYYQQNYSTVDANWQEGNTYIGDCYDWGWMVRFASIGYLSFELPIIPVGYKLQSAGLMMYISGVKGNSLNHVYPVFDYGISSVFPEGVLEHIDFGGTFNSIDVIPSTIYATYTLFDHETLMAPCWVSYDVTDCLVLDISANRILSQYRIYLNGFSDWDNLDDYFATTTDSSPYNPYAPKIVYTLSDGVANIDPSIPRPQTIINAYPNPFAEQSTITVKLANPGFCNLKIYNNKGQLVRNQIGENGTAGDHTFLWDGKDDLGKQVGSGIYIVSVNSGTQKGFAKIVYMR